MARDDRRPSQDPDLQHLQELARRGRDELDQFDTPRAEQLWGRVRQEALGEHETVTPMAPQRDRVRRWWPVAAAAALALVVGVGLGTTIGAGDPASEPAVLASVELEALREGLDARTATLQEDARGRTVTVDLSGLPATDGFHEVWLLDPDTGALVSLGPVRTDDVYAVPETVDLVELSVLDVSAEPSDGDPGHSGDSLLRGEVRWTG